MNIGTESFTLSDELRSANWHLWIHRSSPDSSNAIYINGLSPDTTEADIRNVFSKFGGIKMVNARHVASGGFAFVFFEQESGASNALVWGHDSVYS